MQELRWCKANDLQTGQLLLCSNGQSIAVLGKESIKSQTDLYDISVKQHHNFLSQRMTL